MFTRAVKSANERQVIQVLRQGRVTGIWQTKTVRGKLESTVTLFEDFSPAERTVLAEKTEEYAAFRGLTLKQCTVQPL